MGSVAVLRWSERLPPRPSPSSLSMLSPLHRQRKVHVWLRLEALLLTKISNLLAGRHTCVRMTQQMQLIQPDILPKWRDYSFFESKVICQFLGISPPHLGHHIRLPLLAVPASLSSLRRSNLPAAQFCALSQDQLQGQSIPFSTMTTHKGL